MSYDEQPDGDIHGECALEITRPKAENERLRAEMERILEANPRNWDELSEPQGEFERWAKARIKFALAAIAQEKPNG